MSVTNIKNIWTMFKNSVKIMAASAVAVIGCISNPIDPEDADILAIPCVIINCPPNWHKKAKANKFKNSFNDDGIKLLDSNIEVGIENKQQNKVE